MESVTDDGGGSGVGGGAGGTAAGSGSGGGASGGVGSAGPVEVAACGSGPGVEVSAATVVLIEWVGSVDGGVSAALVTEYEIVAPLVL